MKFRIHPYGNETAETVPVKPGDIVKATIYSFGKAIPIVDSYGAVKLFEVVKQRGRLGLKWNEGEEAEKFGEFVAFEEFAPNVEFETVEG